MSERLWSHEPNASAGVISTNPESRMCIDSLRPCHVCSGVVSLQFLPVLKACIVAIEPYHHKRERPRNPKIERTHKSRSSNEWRVFPYALEWRLYAGARVTPHGEPVQNILERAEQKISRLPRFTNARNANQRGNRSMMRFSRFLCHGAHFPAHAEVDAPKRGGIQMCRLIPGLRNVIAAPVIPPAPAGLRYWL